MTLRSIPVRSLGAMALCAWLASAPVDGAESRVAAELQDWKPGLTLLQSSRAPEALEWFESRRTARREDVCGYYFPALLYTNFDIDGLSPEEEQTRGLALLDEGIELGEGQVDSGETSPGTRYCLGALRGLRAADRLRRSKYMGAAFDAKHARAVMLDLIDDDPGCVDCRFWVGSYDYFADVLPGVVKFFRSLLFFPKGDKERGLAALGEVADRGDLDRFNAHWLLYSLYAGLERQPDRALEMLERIRALYPENVDAALALGWHHGSVAQPPDRQKNIAIHLEILERIAKLEAAHRDELENRVRVSLARAYLDDLLPDPAIELLEAVRETTEGHDERRRVATGTLIRAYNHAGQHARAVRLLEEYRQAHPESAALDDLERIAHDFDAPSSRAFGEALVGWRLGRYGETERAETLFAELLERTAEPAVVHFVMASLAFELGRFAEAERHYRAVIEAAPDHPTGFLPFSHLRLGNLLDLAGDRRQAKTEYRKTVKTAGERQGLRDGAKFYLSKPYEGPGGVPSR